MSSNNLYQPPTSDLKTDFLNNKEVNLWMPQASMLAEQGKSEASIRNFLKIKGIEEKYLTEAAKYAVEKGQRDKFTGQLPYTILGWILIIPSLIWLLYTLITYNSFMFILLFPIGIGYGLVKGVLPTR